MSPTLNKACRSLLNHIASGFVALLVAAALSSAHAQQIRYEVPAESFDPGPGDGRMWVDFNNDSKDDYCKLLGSRRDILQCHPSTGSGFGAVFQVTIDQILNHPVPSQWVDVNGDGKVDFCRLLTMPGSIYNSTGVVSCRLGDGFTTTVTTTLPLVSYPEGGDSPPPPTQGLNDPRDLFFPDVDADGRADVCYINYPHDGYNWNSGELRCRLSTGTGFTGESSAWSRMFVDKGSRDWPRGFHDFNGDGFPDFCMLRLDSRLSCTLGGPNGFSSQDIVSSALANAHSEGSAFVDINGDGKTDFCRVSGTSYTNFVLACTVSNGRGWEAADIQSANLNVGHAMSRWWVDINADGLVDFCRAVGIPPEGDDEGFYDDYSHMSCRLNLGIKGAFAHVDLQLNDVNFGRADGGRSFCDPHGNGVETFCRTTRSKVLVEQCYLDENGAQVCYMAPSGARGLFTGFSDTVHAEQSVLTAFSDGLGAETRITYLPMTNSHVYKRSGFGTYPRSLISLPRSLAVFETRAWRRVPGVDERQWPPLTGTARYFYKDLRYDTHAGSRGFRERWMLAEGSNTIDHTVYYQALGPAVDPGSILNDVRELGQTRLQERYAIATSLIQPVDEPLLNARQRFLKATMAKATSVVEVQPAAPTADSPFVLLQRTKNTVGSAVKTELGIGPEVAADNPRFRPIVASTTESWDWNGSAHVPMPRVDNTSKVDSLGNVMELVQLTSHGGLQWQKKTANQYSKDNRDTWLLGRLSRSEVTSTAPSAAAQLSLHARSAGSSNLASQISGTASPAPSPPQPLSAATLSAILQLLLDD